MITGGDYLFKFYLVVFTIDDRAIRLDSRLFTNGEHFLMTLRIYMKKHQNGLIQNICSITGNAKR